jgi:hypothetical protein
MVKGRKGLYLEAWKFSVYISIPVIASVYHANPETQKKWADYYKFIQYPENPNTNVKQKIQALAKEKEDKREQHLAYQRQLQALQESAERSQKYQPEEPQTSIWGRIGRWFSRSSSSSTRHE